MKRVSLVVMAVMLQACGVVGAPVAPETIGVAPVIERQKLKQEASRIQETEERSNLDANETDPVPQAQDEELLPLRPVGTR
ncbi:MAG: hypothetical protein NNA21_08845 [Nitrospira sp.]|nr:hypothetical protein [Nitrospira sp.]MCP9462637.1 hypothetical protein [Nitrospira sp.]MCP9474782.1 hypothetical protein [Nitrospira sp.]